MMQGIYKHWYSTISQRPLHDFPLIFRELFLIMFLMNVYDIAGYIYTGACCTLVLKTYFIGYWSRGIDPIIKRIRDESYRLYTFQDNLNKSRYTKSKFYKLISIIYLKNILFCTLTNSEVGFRRRNRFGTYMPEKLYIRWSNIWWFSISFANLKRLVKKICIFTLLNYSHSSGLRDVDWRNRLLAL